MFRGPFLVLVGAPSPSRPTCRGERETGGVSGRLVVTSSAIGLPVGPSLGSGPESGGVIGLSVGPPSGCRSGLEFGGVT